MIALLPSACEMAELFARNCDAVVGRKAAAKRAIRSQMAYRDFLMETVIHQARAMHVVSRFEQGLGHFAKLLSPLSIPVVCPRSLPHPVY
jgi:hypothetical protein